jgi:hypothetical protein
MEISEFQARYGTLEVAIQRWFCKVLEIDENSIGYIDIRVKSILVNMDVVYDVYFIIHIKNSTLAQINEACLRNDNVFSIIAGREQMAVIAEKSKEYDSIARIVFYMTHKELEKGKAFAQRAMIEREILDEYVASLDKAMDKMIKSGEKKKAFRDRMIIKVDTSKDQW